MLSLILRQAHWLDLWLHRRLGRPYNAVLVFALGLSITATVNALAGAIAAGEKDFAATAVRTVAIVAFQAALLVNQLAQLDEHRARRRRERLRRREKGRVAAAHADR
jgi:hypothetical protein